MGAELHQISTAPFLQRCKHRNRERDPTPLPGRKTKWKFKSKHLQMNPMTHELFPPIPPEYSFSMVNTVKSKAIYLRHKQGTPLSFSTQKVCPQYCNVALLFWQVYFQKQITAWKATHFILLCTAINKCTNVVLNTKFTMKLEQKQWWKFSSNNKHTVSS